MPKLRHPGAHTDRAVGASAGRPVLLLTLGVPFDPDAAAVAVDTAVENGQPLFLVNVVDLPPLAMSVRMGYDQLPEAADEEAYRAPAELAYSLGVDVQRYRVKTMRPVEAMLEVMAELSPGLLVFGPDRERLGRRRYRRAAKAIRKRAPCLVWLPD